MTPSRLAALLAQAEALEKEVDWPSALVAYRRLSWAADTYATELAKAHALKCPVCGYEDRELSPWCPNCGAEAARSTLAREQGER